MKKNDQVSEELEELKNIESKHYKELKDEITELYMQVAKLRDLKEFVQKEVDGLQIRIHNTLGSVYFMQKRVDKVEKIWKLMVKMYEEKK